MLVLKYKTLPYQESETHRDSGILTEIEACTVSYLFHT